MRQSTRIIITAFQRQQESTEPGGSPFLPSRSIATILSSHQRSRPCLFGFSISIFHLPPLTALGAPQLEPVCQKSTMMGPPAACFPPRRVAVACEVSRVMELWESYLARRCLTIINSHRLSETCYLPGAVLDTMKEILPCDVIRISLRTRRLRSKEKTRVQRPERKSLSLGPNQRWHMPARGFWPKAAVWEGAGKQLVPSASSCVGGV